MAELTRSASILIVDDNPANVALLETMLENDGCENVTSTTDSRDVLPLYRENKFDLILLDLQMPHMDGFEVMERLSSEIKNDYVPVLVLTAYGDPKTRVRALESGAKDFITKPIQAPETMQRIRNMLEVRSLYNYQRSQAERLEEQVRHRTQELHDTQMEVIRRLSAAGEYRDNETGNHIFRISQSCHVLARAIGLDEHRCELLRHAGPLHDVGKIGIPDRILLKPGALDDAEWEIMKTHTVIGAKILGEHEYEVLVLAREIALRHHERWDGEGYPGGQKGEETSIEARVVAVCDVFDALTSKRPYKEAWTIQEAARYLSENAGRRFEPRLVNAFIEVLPQISAIRHEYADDDS